MKMFFLLLAFMLTVGFTSCTPEELIDDKQVEQSSASIDPPSEEAGEEEELKPNK